MKGLSSGDESLAITAYEDLVTRFDLRDPATRGSGTVTAITALVLAAARPSDPAGASRLAAQAIGTDTDTIATMAGALIGATETAPEAPHVLDMDYISSEAIRLADIASGKETKQFSYPDLLGWTPPRSQLDAVGYAGPDVVLAGLGWLKPVEGAKPVGSRSTKWLWTESDFGPTFLVKHRADLRQLAKGNWPVRREQIVNRQWRERWLAGALPGQLTLDNVTDVGRTTSPPADIRTANEAFQVKGGRPSSDRPPPDLADIDQMLVWVARRGYSEEAIGYATRRIAQIGTVEQLVTFTTALRAAIRRSRQ